VAPVDFQAAYGKGAALGVERRPFQATGRAIGPSERSRPTIRPKRQISRTNRPAEASRTAAAAQAVASALSAMAARPASSRATGTRNGEQET
jgi:hypothetical protein